MDEVVENILEAKWESYGKEKFYNDLGYETTLVLLFFFNAAFIIPEKIVQKSDTEQYVLVSSLVLLVSILILDMKKAYGEYIQ